MPGWSRLARDAWLARRRPSDMAARAHCSLCTHDRMRAVPHRAHRSAGARVRAGGERGRVHGGRAQRARDLQPAARGAHQDRGRLQSALHRSNRRAGAARLLTSAAGLREVGAVREPRACGCAPCTARPVRLPHVTPMCPCAQQANQPPAQPSSCVCTACLLHAFASPSFTASPFSPGLHAAARRRQACCSARQPHLHEHSAGTECSAPAWLGLLISSMAPLVSHAAEPTA